VACTAHADLARQIQSEPRTALMSTNPTAWQEYDLSTRGGSIGFARRSIAAPLPGSRQRSQTELVSIALQS